MYLSKDRAQSKQSHTTKLVQLKLLDDDSCCKAWDDFVYAHPNGTFFHLSAWKKLYENYFHLQTYYLYTQTDGKVTGVLPLARIKSKLFSDALISSPFSVYGGLLASHPADVERLLNEAKTIAQSQGVDYLELRQVNDLCQEGYAQSQYVTFQKELSLNMEENLQAIPRKQRAMVRKAIKKDLRFSIEDNVDAFYPLYSESVKNLGTPVLAKSYYRYLTNLFKNNVDILTVYQGDKPISSVLNFYFNKTVLPYYGGGGQLAKSLSANDFMYWSLMNHAVERGVRTFDFGRSKRDTGSYRFKKHWGFEETALNYRVIPIGKSAQPNISPTNPKYHLMIKCWKQLPLGVANLLGPVIARRIG